LVEIPGPAVPPGGAAGLRVLPPGPDAQPPAAEPGEGLPLGRGYVGAAVTGLGVPHVDVLGRHVEVAAEHDGLARISRLGEPAGEAVEPGELGLEEGRAEGPPVR